MQIIPANFKLQSCLMMQVNDDVFKTQQYILDSGNVSNIILEAPPFF